MARELSHDLIEAGPAPGAVRVRRHAGTGRYCVEMFCGPRTIIVTASTRVVGVRRAWKTEVVRRHPFWAHFGDFASRSSADQLADNLHWQNNPYGPPLPE